MPRVCQCSSRFRQRGSTLIEVLVALLLLGLALGGSAVSQTQALAVARDASFTLQATLLAEERAEMVRAFGASGIPTTERAAWQARVEARLPNPSIEYTAPASSGAGEIEITWSTSTSSDRSDARLVRFFHP